MLKPDQKVRHINLGIGTVIAVDNETATVQFTHGIERKLLSEFESITTIHDKINNNEFDTPLNTITAMQARCINSVNDKWGVFFSSKIDILPHQLWVCKKAMDLKAQEKPIRLLIADDVGLGKTIEAGLILQALRSRNQLQNLLIICPASITGQWVSRMWDMFGIDTDPYNSQDENFFSRKTSIVVSMQTIRLNNTENQETRRNDLLTSREWDMVLVDEAHHLNFDENGGMTQGYQLLNELVIERNKNCSVLFFTGTPHKGKNFNFISLLQLLRPDLFDNKAQLEDQFKNLNEVMIRNNKSNVTDLNGDKLFKKTTARSITYYYSEEEKAFYNKMTAFITSGKLYAGNLTAKQTSAVILVLITMQKIASSSVAAIKKALERRLVNIGGNNNPKNENLINEIEENRKEWSSDNADKIAAEEEALVSVTKIANENIILVNDEAQWIQELIELANDVKEETKITTILKIVKTEFKEDSVLFFTEYKATQAMLVSELMKNYGEDKVVFINGDNRLDNVIMPDGNEKNVAYRRENAKDRFNRGVARFLVSTEAAGEGIDLQESCHVLIHVDMPWNPMRMHQRVGRINRYGQKYDVTAISVRNPETVESRVWEKLEEKISNINQAMLQAMEDPEDMSELVLGIVSPGFIDNIFFNAPRDIERINNWFDVETATFAGIDAIDTVQKMLGNVSKFSFNEYGNRVPKVDIIDLKSFLQNSLTLNGRRLTQNKHNNKKFNFKTPLNWVTNDQIQRDFEVEFDRKSSSRDRFNDIISIENNALKSALKETLEVGYAVTFIEKNDFKSSIALFKIASATTENHAVLYQGVLIKDGCMELLSDWRVLLELNKIETTANVFRQNAVNQNIDKEELLSTIIKIEEYMDSKIGEVDHSFKIPVVELELILLAQ